MITCVVEYTIVPDKIEAFENFAERWMGLVNSHGGQHHGYFLPGEGVSDKALALFTFESLAAYETYRALFGVDPDFIDADRIRDESGCVLRYERSFMRPLLPERRGAEEPIDMGLFTEVTLHQAETDFQRALLTNDVAALDQVLHDDVHFIGPDGATIDKATDLAAHRSQAFTLTAVNELDRQVQVTTGVGITRTALHLLGATREHQVLDMVLAYTRTWVPSKRGWLIISAHGSQGASPA